jgi:glycosidase
VAPDTALFRVYKDLIALRAARLPLFVDGTLTWLVADDARRLLAYERALGAQRAIVAFNASDMPQEIGIPADGTYRLVFPTGGAVTASGGTLRVTLPARAAQVWVRE